MLLAGAVLLAGCVSPNAGRTPAFVEVPTVRGSVVTNAVRFKLHPFARLILIDAAVDGKPCTLLLDTGATHTVLDTAFVKATFPSVQLYDLKDIIVETNAKEIPQSFPCKSLKLGETELKDFSMMTMNLQHISMALGQKVDGILGANALGHAPFILDVGRRTITWVPRGETPAGADALPTARAPDGTGIALNVIAGNKAFHALLDTGASMSIFPEAFWPGTGDPVEVGSVGVNETEGAKLSTVNRGEPTDLILGKSVAAKAFVPFLTPEKDALPLLGMDVISRLVLYVDFKDPEAFLIGVRPESKK